MKKPRRALISVSDKTDLDKIARVLVNYGVELVSTGGTAAAIKGFGLPCTLVEAVTYFPEMMDGRVKTLHPKIHGALLKVRGNPEHEAAAQEHGIGEFDFVIVSLYPFQKTIAKKEVTFQEAIENIDIGGPAMLRSGAKNSESVTVVVEPADYAVVIESLSSNEGQTTLGLRRKLAAKVFTHTGAYDGMIGNWLSKWSDFESHLE